MITQDEHQEILENVEDFKAKVGHMFRDVDSTLTHCSNGVKSMSGPFRRMMQVRYKDWKRLGATDESIDEPTEFAADPHGGDVVYWDTSGHQRKMTAQEFCGRTLEHLIDRTRFVIQLEG